MQCNLSNLYSSRVNIFYLTELSIYRMKSKETNVTVYTQLYKLKIKSYVKILPIVYNKCITSLCATRYISEFRNYSTNM